MVFNNKIPEYYKNMHLDGYSANEVYQSFRQKIMKDYHEKLEKERQEKELNQMIEQKVHGEVEKSIKELFSGFSGTIDINL